MKKMLKQTLVILVALIAGAVAQAESLYITNHNFEAQALSQGQSSTSIDGWDAPGSEEGGE